MRLGIVFRLLGVLALGAVVAFNSAAIKDRLINGEYGHYTVMLKAGSDSESASKTHTDMYGLYVERLSTNTSTNGYVAAVPTKAVDQLRSDDRVSYLILDNAVQTEHHWWDDVMITLGQQTPHFN